MTKEEKLKEEIRELTKILVLNFRYNIVKPELPTGKRNPYDGKMELYNDQMKWYLKAKKINKIDLNL